MIIKSNDGAATWKWASNGFPVQAVWTLAIDPTASSTVYAGSQGGLYRTENRGGIWAAADSGLSALKVFALAGDPASPAVLYAGTEIGLFKSEDSGESWAPVIYNAGQTPVWSLAILPGSSTILAGTNGGIWRSTDGGATWSQIPTLFVYAFAIDPRSPSTVYGVGAAGPSPSQLSGATAISTDAGTTWTAPFGFWLNTLPIVNAIAVDPISSSTFYIGTEAGAYKTILDKKGNLQWMTNGALEQRIVFALLLDPGAVSTLYAGTDNGLYKSVDGGLSWKSATNGLTAGSVYVLLVDPTSPSTFYAGTDSGVFRSTDGGSTWASFGRGLGPNAIDALAPGPGFILYAGTLGGSVYRYPAAPSSRHVLPIEPSPPAPIGGRH